MEAEMPLSLDMPAHIGQPSVERAARKRLAKTGYRSLGSVRCNFRDGTIILHGSVPSYYHKQIAQEAMRDVDNVEAIVNQIKVSP
jgi:hypothetical protein